MDVKKLKKRIKQNFNEKEVKCYIVNSKTYHELEKLEVASEYDTVDEVRILLAGGGMGNGCIEINNEKIPLYITESVEDNNILAVLKEKDMFTGAVYAPFVTMTANPSLNVKGYNKTKI